MLTEGGRSPTEVSKTGRLLTPAAFESATSILTLPSEYGLTAADTTSSGAANRQRNKIQIIIKPLLVVSGAALHLPVMPRRFVAACFVNAVQSRYPLYDDTALLLLLLCLPCEANNACSFSFPVLQYSWRLRPFVRRLGGSLILTNSIAFFHTLGFSSVVIISKIYLFTVYCL